MKTKEESKVIKSKQKVWEGKSYTVNLTEENIEHMKHRATVTKLNGWNMEQYIESLNWSEREDWKEEAIQIFNDTVAEVTVGTPATENLYSDRRAKTVVEVISPRKIVVAENETECIDYYAGEYKVLDEIAEYMSKEVFTLRKGGTWVAEGQPKKFGSVTLTLGYRRHYIDPSF